MGQCRGDCGSFGTGYEHVCMCDFDRHEKDTGSLIKKYFIQPLQQKPKRRKKTGSDKPKKMVTKKV